MNASLEWCDTDMTKDLGVSRPPFAPKARDKSSAAYNTAPAIGCGGWWCGIFRRAKRAWPASPASRASPAWPAYAGMRRSTGAAAERACHKVVLGLRGRQASRRPGGSEDLEEGEGRGVGGQGIWGPSHWKLLCDLTLALRSLSLSWRVADPTCPPVRLTLTQR